MTFNFFAGQKTTAAQFQSLIPQLVFLTSPQLVNSLTAVPINGLSWPVQAGNTYRVNATLFATQGATTAQQGIGISGPAASNIAVGFHTMAEGNAATVEFGCFELGTMNTQAPLFSTGVGNMPANDKFLTLLSGALTFTASGTFALTCECVTAAADTWTLRANTFAELLQE